MTRRIARHPTRGSMATAARRAPQRRRTPEALPARPLQRARPSRRATRRGGSVARRAALFCALLASTTAGALLARPAAAQLPHGSLVVTDHARILVVDPQSGFVATLAAGAPLSLPTSVAVDRDGTLLVADWHAPTNPPGSVFRVDPASGAVTTVASSAPLTTPHAVVVEPDGTILVGDLDAGSHLPLLGGGVFRRGAIFSLDPASGAVAPLARDCCEWNPAALALSARGELYAADLGCCVFLAEGGLSRIDRATGTSAAIHTSVPLLDPSGVAVDPASGELIVTEATNPQPGEAAVLRIDPATGSVATIAAGSPLVDPRNVVLAEGGELLVADSGAAAVLRITREGSIATIASGAPLRAPWGLALVTRGSAAGGSTPASSAVLACARHDAAALGLSLRAAAGCWARARGDGEALRGARTHLAGSTGGTGSRSGARPAARRGWTGRDPWAATASEARGERPAPSSNAGVEGRGDDTSAALAACRATAVVHVTSQLADARSCPAADRAATTHLAGIAVDGLFDVLDRSVTCAPEPIDAERCSLAERTALLLRDALLCRARAVEAAFAGRSFDLAACDQAARRIAPGRPSEARCPPCIRAAREKRDAAIAFLAGLAGASLYRPREEPAR